MGSQLPGFVSGLLKFFGVEGEFFELAVDFGPMASRKAGDFRDVSVRKLEQSKEVALFATGLYLLKGRRIGVGGVQRAKVRERQRLMLGFGEYLFQMKVSICGESDAAFDHISEFANITRPIIGKKSAPHFRGNERHGAAESLAEVLAVMVHENGNILAPIPQWWNMHSNHGQAKEEISSKRSCLH